MGRFILRSGRLRKDGRATITFSGHVGGQRIYTGTGMSVKPADWDEVRQQVRRTDPNYAQLNAKLRDIEAQFEKKVAALDDVNTGEVERLRRELSRRTDPNVIATSEQDMKFWTGYAAFMKAKKAERDERTIAKYKTLENILHQFEGGFGKLLFERITHDFYDAFKSFLIKKRKLTNNTIGKYVSTLKTYLGWAEERGAIIPNDYRKFKVDEEDVEVIALTWDELQRLASLDLANNTRLDRIRDLFLFACYTGARFGDVQKLNFDDIRGSAWHLRMGKTKTETRIPLISQAMEIVDKYRKEKSLPLISSQRMNDYLKELGNLADISEPVRVVRYMGAKRIEDRGKKWEFMSSHVARRTFVTVALERGMRPEVVMSITGHRSFKTMKKYIALTEQSRSEAMESVWKL